MTDTNPIPTNLAMRDRNVQWVIPPQPAPEAPLTVFTACDPVYLDYAVSLVRSLEVFAPGTPAMIHLVNPRPQDTLRVQDLRASLRSTPLAVSAERIDLSGFEGDQRRAYYASARFLRLTELMRDQPATYFSLDADSLVVAEIDLDFTNKAQADVCLIRRDQQGGFEARHAVANGSILLRPTDPTRVWLSAVADELAALFTGGKARWFVDQEVVGRQVAAFEQQALIVNLKAKYADWEFRTSSIVWSGKGQRKSVDPRFSLLQRLLLDAPYRQVQALRAAREVFDDESEGSRNIRAKLDRASVLVPPLAVLLVPRLDQPWGTAIRGVRLPPLLADDTLELRLHWKAFAARLANAIERKGVHVHVDEVPAWQIDGNLVASSGADVALVPHRCRLDFEVGELPVFFYMQEYFRDIFVVDAEGWSAAASVYPVPFDRLQPGSTGHFDVYRERLAAGALGSKFRQPEQRSHQELVASGLVPEGDYVFLPLQIPHDQSLRYFSDVSMHELLTAMLEWSQRTGVRLVVKPHPVNLASMREFEPLVRNAGAWWTTGHVHDLIAHARAVYTINSGVGFEALLHLKPVVTFGRCEYDCVSIPGRIDALDETWARANDDAGTDLAPRYRRFVDWFLGDHAVDMSLPDARDRRLDAIATQIAAQARASRLLRSSRLAAAADGQASKARPA